MRGSDVEREEPGERSPVAGAERPLAIELAAEVASASVVRQRVGEWRDAHGWPPDERDDIVLAVHEAVANVVDHAYRDGAPGPVRVTGRVRRWSAGRRGQAVVTVRDEGRWKPVPSDAGFCGHGLAVMDGMMNGVRIGTDADGTEVILASTVVPLGCPPERARSPLHRGGATISVRVRSDARTDPRWASSNGGSTPRGGARVTCAPGPRGCSGRPRSPCGRAPTRSAGGGRFERAGEPQASTALMSPR